ncbi:MAG: glycerol kinase GlpK [Anaerolineales bacterium]|nr:glycerol kinase GlpK [Anaerolineales bacterium]
MKKYLLALDQGTTSSRAIIFNLEGSLISSAQKEFPQIYPKSGWVEHNAEDIWSSQYETAQAAITRACLTAADIIAIGVTNQRETTVVWDRETGIPISNAIVWQCRRTAAMCDSIKSDGFDKAILQKTGLVTDAYFSGTKLSWILDNIEGARKSAEQGTLAFGTIDSFLIWRLTGGKVHATDVSNASRTMLYNIHTNQWDDEILEYLNIPSSVLPEVRPSSSNFGLTAPSIFNSSIPITGVAGDQQAATFGQACFEPGMAKNTYGTGCFLLLNTGPEPVTSGHGLLTTIGWKLGSEKPVYCAEGSVFIAGAAVQWLRDGLGIINKSEDIEELARKENPQEDLYFVPAFVGLGAPYWDPYARGTIIGLSRDTTASHIASATLHSIAYQVRDVLEAMHEDSDVRITALRVDGGASANNYLMQFQADILGVPVERPVIRETTALGAAYLAGLSMDVLSLSSITGQWKLDKRFEPQMESENRDHLYARWKDAVLRSRDWIRRGN